MSICCRNGFLGNALLTPTLSRPRTSRTRSGATFVARLEALVLDCDGVIVESENLHRVAYNESFKNFDVRIDQELVEWSEEFYDDFQNKVGGGKPKMRWYFGNNGYPSSTDFPTPPEDPDSREALIDQLQEWKSAKYKQLMGSGEVRPRPGILRIIQEARDNGLKVAVCSAATKASVIFTLENLLGNEIFSTLDCFLAGDDVKEKKPNPLIYKVASEKLGVDPENCLVIEDSAIGLEAALGAGMRCIITYTRSSKSQAFDGAELIVPDLDHPTKLHIDQFLQTDAVEEGNVV